GQAGAQAHRGLAVDLAGARFAHPQHRADLAQVQLLLVVQRQHQALALGQAVDGRGKRAAELGLFELALGPGDAVAGQPRLAVVLIHVRVQAHQLSARGVFHHAVVLVQRYAHRRGDFLGRGGLAGTLLDLAGGRDDVAVASVHRTRHPVAAADLVDHRAADADRGVGLEGCALVGLEVAGGVDQAEHAGLDQVVDLDAGGQPRGEVMGDAAHQLTVLLDHLGGRALLVGAVLRGGGNVHAVAPLADGNGATRRSRKNSTWPRAPAGDCHWRGRRAMSRKATAEGEDGNTSTTGSWRWIARRSHSSRGIAPRQLRVTSRKRALTRSSLSNSCLPSRWSSTWLASTCTRVTPRSRLSTLIRA